MCAFDNEQYRKHGIAPRQERLDCTVYGGRDRMHQLTFEIDDQEYRALAHAARLERRSVIAMAQRLIRSALVRRGDLDRAEREQ